MDEDVAVWYRWLQVVSIVCVGDANNMDFVWLVFELGWTQRSVK